LLLTKIIQ